MNNLTTTGRWMFALTFIMGGLLHLTGADFTATQVPTFLGVPYFWVYFTGLAQLAFAISALTKRYDKLATLLLFVMMVVFIAAIHIPKAVAGDFMGIISTMRDFGYAGATLLYAGAVAQDKRVVG